MKTFSSQQGINCLYIDILSCLNVFKMMFETPKRMLYAIDLMIWYLRLLHVSILFKSVGPKLVMIQKMVCLNRNFHNFMPKVLITKFRSI